MCRIRSALTAAISAIHSLATLTGQARWSSGQPGKVWSVGIADYSDWVPNIAESVDVSADATAYTFHLRQGLKWSDGVPFTADDVVFYIDDIMNNTELNGGSFPDWLAQAR